jgi:hypothetical protein
MTAVLYLVPLKVRPRAAISNAETTAAGIQEEESKENLRRIFLLGFFTLGNGADKLSRNVGK